jgi:hypothetical protein
LLKDLGSGKVSGQNTKENEVEMKNHECGKYNGGASQNRSDIYIY